MPASTSWADRIKLAQENSVKFAPLELGEKNFEVEKAVVKTSSNGNTYLNIQAKVIDGPQANARVFYRLFPNSDKARPINEVLKFVEAVGTSIDWLQQANPSLEEMASNFQGRKFSAEVYVEDDAREDSYTNAPQRSIRNPKPQGALSESVPATPPNADYPTPSGTPDPTFGKSPMANGFSNNSHASVPENPWNNSIVSEPPF